MNLTPAQISLIRSVIDQSRLTTPSLKEDVLDHLCCLVEKTMMDSGNKFEAALQQALFQLSPEGLDEIQNETDYLLNSTLSAMKKLMYSIGLVTSMSFTMGLMMKLLHMPGGEELINYGFLGFALLFIPMITTSRLRSGTPSVSHEKFKILFGVLSAVCTGLAVSFKMTMNLDAATVMLMAGASLFSFGFLPLHFLGMYRKSVAR